ncbi:hypothetical protein CsSME_00007985 [Camellia sinensis var. sinensis]
MLPNLCFVTVCCCLPASKRWLICLVGAANWSSFLIGLCFLLILMDLVCIFVLFSFLFCVFCVSFCSFDDNVVWLKSLLFFSLCLLLVLWCLRDASCKPVYVIVFNL